jgi:uncharacterized membrane protein YfcA
MTFVIIVAALAVVAGAIASVAGFGIGSILTPVVALRLGLAQAVAVVSLPHFAATVLRAWRLREDVSREVLLRFGIASAVGGLTGAVLHEKLNGSALGVVFGCLLVFAGAMGVTGLSKKLRFGHRTAWIAGIASGAFGGLVGNQGGIRSAALLGFDIEREAFVATGTAVGVVVDLARLPVYLAKEGDAILAAWLLVIGATIGVLVGTVVGERLLRRIPENAFRAVVSTIILALGIAVLAGLGR